MDNHQHIHNSNNKPNGLIWKSNIILFIITIIIIVFLFQIKVKRSIKYEIKILSRDTQFLKEQQTSYTTCKIVNSKKEANDLLRRNMSVLIYDDSIKQKYFHNGRIEQIDPDGIVKIVLLARDLDLQEASEKQVKTSAIIAEMHQSLFSLIIHRN
ncbi:hypothetical protein [Pedobacter cryoconitis]|uniref:Uncharacterized protein n=1 Tax=Pedobacter cryoconitis TaxID=188932 RepID=A0A327SNF4_9SPHI|nr:hypothetical protein [Pedobacter cryoconitis]RAJ27217.1 hypothetical protein LY11_03507 [Pedobacter cryoconitis]